MLSTKQKVKVLFLLRFYAHKLTGTEIITSWSKGVRFSIKQIWLHCLFELESYCLLTQLRSCQASQLTYSHFFWEGCPLSVDQYSGCIYFCQSQAMPFLNQQKGEKVCREYFMVNLCKNYVTELRFELVSPGSAVRHTTDCAKEPGLHNFSIVYTFWAQLFKSLLA